MIGFIDNLLSNVDPSSADKIIELNSEILRGWYSIPQDAILIFMMFAFLGVIPYNVFGRIYNISRRRLILTLLVSTLSPLVFLTISLYTCCIPIVILIIGVAMYNIFRTKKVK